MTKYMLTTLALAACLVGATATAQNGTSAVRLAVREDSKLWIEGSSNLHGWSCKATTLDAAINVDPAWEAAALGEPLDVAKLLKSVEVKVPVEGMKCGNGKMERIMYEALRSGTAPSISYILGSFDAVPGEAKDSFIVHTVGKLTIAGKENTVRMDVRAERLPDGAVRAVSEVPVLMTDYGVKPPTALLGTLRTGNKVLVKFELFVGPRALIAANGTDR
jgi:polyisoprenoid-binding protein YceI